MKKRLKLFLLSLAIFMSASCQMHRSDNALFVPDEKLFADQYFTGDVVTPETPEQIFNLPPETQSVIDDIIVRHKTTQERTKAILLLMFAGTDGKKITYRNTATYTASETINNAKANCLSLSILAYSLAKRASMQTIFQDVKIPEYWVNENNRSWLNGHVNLRILHSRLNNATAGYELLGEDIVVDFEPTVRQDFDTVAIDKNRIIAMFYNNKAAEAELNENDSQAYAYYRAAINIDPTYAATWSNLAVLYRKNNFIELAEQLYKRSLQLNPNSLNTMSNLAVLYRSTNRIREADALQISVDNARKSNPYYFIMLGNEALNKSNPDEAIKYFEKSLRLRRGIHEAYFGLAISYAALNELDKTEHYLRQAKRVSQRSEDQQRYSRKLELLSPLAKAH